MIFAIIVYPVRSKKLLATQKLERMYAHQCCQPVVTDVSTTEENLGSHHDVLFI